MNDKGQHSTILFLRPGAAQEGTHQTTIKQTAHGRYLAQAILASDVQVPVGDLKLGELDDLLGREDGELERLDALGGVRGDVGLPHP